MNDKSTFVDTNSDTWHVRVDVNAIQRVRDMVGLDLAEILDEGSDLIQKLDKDPVMLVRTIYAVMEPSIEKRDVTPEQFGERICGDVLQEATTAFLYALCAFFPLARRGPLLAILEESLQMQSRMNALLDGPQFTNAIKSESRKYEKSLRDTLEKYSENGSSSVSE
jgi:hypothetical protein